MQKVRFTKDYRSYIRNKTYEVSNNEAACYVQMKVAVLVATPLPSPTRKPYKIRQMRPKKRGRGAYKTKKKV